MIRIIINIYHQARMLATINHLHTNSIDITQGVLQGDHLALLLFILSISDLVTYFGKNQIQKILTTGNMLS